MVVKARLPEIWPAGSLAPAVFATGFAGQGSVSPLFYCSALVMISAFTLGGGASNALLSNSLIELVAIPAIVFATWDLVAKGAPTDARLIIWLFLGAAALIILQLAPLPPSIWAALPFHDKASIARATLGAASMWAPLSLDPEATLVSFLTLAPPLAIFLAVLCLNWRERRLLALIALVFGVLNAFVGLLQLSQGEESIFYLYGPEAGVTVGLFANRNHEAALLYALVPLAAAWIGVLTPTLSGKGSRRRDRSRAIIRILPPIVAIVVFIVAAFMSQSRAGLILLFFALASGVALQPFNLPTEDGRLGLGIFSGVTLLALLLGGYYGVYRILARFDGDMLTDARLKIAELTYHSALKAIPFGVGLGAFVPAYASIEKTQNLLLDRFANQAHNEYLQIAMETGIPGLALLAGFLLWFAKRFQSVWSAPLEDGSLQDVLLMRAASISVTLLLLHSLVDYPLRTEAMLVFLAFCCGSLVRPPLSVAGERSVDSIGGVSL